MTGRASRSLANGQDQSFKPCNCKNSKCLKLYCECFASGRYCNGCNCLNCMNNKDHEAARSKAIETILERNPNAFRPKIQVQQGTGGLVTAHVTRHSKGCSCRKSNCLKKYCECFQAGIFCAQTCRCKDCRNFEGSPHLMAVMGNLDAGGLRQGATLQAASVPEVKRARTAAVRPTSQGASAGQAVPHPPPPRRRNPARDAIRQSRDRKMHEVLANMLTTLHVEALGKEQSRCAQSHGASSSANNVNAAQPIVEENQSEAHLSDYFVKTEGILLAEFGDFLGKFADRIDSAVSNE